MHLIAQLLFCLSLSLSFAISAMLLCHANEYAAVPEYDWHFKSIVRLLITNVIPVIFGIHSYSVFQSSKSTRRELGLAAVSLWILSFPNQNSPVS